MLISGFCHFAVENYVVIETMHDGSRRLRVFGR
jgi:hypothetical protein